MTDAADRLVVPFAAAACRDVALAGGKGANLAILSGAGLPVPPGFCVTTEAYAAFSSAIGLDQRVAHMLSVLGDDADSVENRTAEIRHFITTSPLPTIVVDAILRAYGALPPDTYVAVRSSGTAEDLAGASFAGLHDTYLDIRGADVVLDAVKRCWASMWTARATSYRRSKGFDQSKVKIAVVVQQMVEADVAGVMFTANPLTSATDEIIVNAAYGLGEALVSGIATPDEHILALDTLRVKEQRVGAKEVRVVRDRTHHSGTVTEAVPPDQQKNFALTAANLNDLGKLGHQIMTLYQNYPQDIEWAIARDKLYLLQARPITGVEFSWDDHLDYWQPFPDNDDILWTRSWADEVWNGAISPLAYSYRGHMFTVSAQNCARLCGIKGDLNQRVYKYYKAEAYFNTAVERQFVEGTAFQKFRPALLAHTSPEAKEQILGAPFGLLGYLRMHLNMIALGYGPYKWFGIAYDYLDNRIAEADGLSSAQLQKLSDPELCAELEHFVDLKTKFSSDLWTGFFIYARDAMSLLGEMLTRWYDGTNASIFADLFSGLPRRTPTAEENLRLWQLSEKIRTSPGLKSAFAAAGPKYLEAFEIIPEGRDFLTDYRAFLAANGHRGHADRDPYFDRRADDAAIDYENFRLLLSTSVSVDPEEREHQVDARREAAIADVEARFSKKFLGGLRVWLFRRLTKYAYDFFYIRDGQRHYFDRYTYAIKRLAVEFGRRLKARGIFLQQEDAYFLGRQELYKLLEGKQIDPLLPHKIASRRRNFERMLRKEANPPAYLRRGKPMSFTSEGTGSGNGVFQGVGTSRGTITARARIVTELRNIGQVAEGEILITQSTDPGWTPVFNLIKGIVLETGGMLAHGSCLAREYGFPAVQLAGATRLIPDGAIITVNGDTGMVVIHADSET